MLPNPRASEVLPQNKAVRVQIELGDQNPAEDKSQKKNIKRDAYTWYN